MAREKFKVKDGVFDEQTNKTINSLIKKGYIDELLTPIKTGKEADVYLAKRKNSYAAVKIYRVTSANFKKINEYIKRDYRFKNTNANIKKTILKWVEKEYRNLHLSYVSGVHVPFPIKQLHNCIVMEYINADMLKDTYINDPTNFFEKLLHQLYLLKNEAKLIHGDLSQYNILVENQRPVIIDLGQAMSIKQEEDFNNFYDLYERDINQLLTYFENKYNLDYTKEKIDEKLSSNKS